MVKMMICEDMITIYLKFAQETKKNQVDAQNSQ
jgi:hypothetical protein